MPRKTNREMYDIEMQQLEKAREKVKRRAAMIKAEERKKAEKDRKARAHRLIQIGSICEEVYGKAITEGAMQEALRDFLYMQDRNGNYYSNALDKAASVVDTTDAADNEIAGPDEII